MAAICTPAALSNHRNRCLRSLEEQRVNMLTLEQKFFPCDSINNYEDLLKVTSRSARGCTSNRLIGIY
jgi:hypothetical protein